jgi:hypothetical protein
VRHGGLRLSGHWHPVLVGDGVYRKRQGTDDVNDFRLMFILLIGLYEDGGDERDLYNISAPVFFRTDRSAREIARSNEPISASDLAALPGSRMQTGRHRCPVSSAKRLSLVWIM